MAKNITHLTKNNLLPNKPNLKHRKIPNRSNLKYRKQPKTHKNREIKINNCLIVCLLIGVTKA